MGKTTIEWTSTRLPDGTVLPGFSFNPWVGCQKVSAACDRCYAESWARRTGQAHLWQGERRRTTAANWREPLKWNRQAEAAGVRRRVFCASLADVFDNQAARRWRDDLWHLIHETPSLDWLLLTKRPQNIAKMLPGESIGAPAWGAGWPNVWLGTTVENQEEADRRIPHLLAAPARVRFLSCEPLLGPLDLEYPASLYPNGPRRCCDGRECGCGGQPIDPPLLYGIHWVIVGGESGPDARPMHPDWARSLRDHCSAAGVAFHFKQWGEWSPCQQTGGHLASDKERDIGGAWMLRAGKKAAGRLLDGAEHNGMPA